MSDESGLTPQAMEDALIAEALKAGPGEVHLRGGEGLPLQMVAKLVTRCRLVIEALIARPGHGVTALSIEAGLSLKATAAALEALIEEGFVERMRKDVRGARHCYRLLQVPDWVTGIDPRSLPARRTCLKCRRKFPSSHAGNRLCDACSSVADNLRSSMG